MGNREYQEKLKSLSFGRPDVRERPNVTEVDARETENESATITEHWDGRVDVNVRPPAATADIKITEV